MAGPTLLPPVLPTPLPSTLTVVTSTYLGEPTVRKSVGKVSTVYTGSEIVDRFISLGAGLSTTIDEPMVMFVIQTPSAIAVAIDGNPAIPVSYFLLVDTGNSTLSITNSGQDVVTLHLSYLTP